MRDADIASLTYDHSNTLYISVSLSLYIFVHPYMYKYSCSPSLTELHAAGAGKANLVLLGGGTCPRSTQQG